jgi:hypothetical protein
MNDLPVACTLGPPALKARREGLLGDLLRRADRHDTLPDGHRFTFAASDEISELIIRVVNAERACCRFLRFQITVEPDEGPMVLALTGPEGTSEFLGALFES